MLEQTATSSKYFNIALQENGGTAVLNPIPLVNSCPPGLDRAGNRASDIEDKVAVRKHRIAAAVQRSKEEYQDSHAYTERGWFHDKHAGAVTNDGNISKIHKQRQEFVTASLYLFNSSVIETISQIGDSNHSESARDALPRILALYDPSKPLGSLTKEMLDVGIRSAIACDNREIAVELARAGRNTWKSSFSGLAVSASDAFVFVGRHYEAIVPLLYSLANFALQYPVLLRIVSISQIISSSIWADRLDWAHNDDRTSSNGPCQIVDRFTDFAKVIAQLRSQAFYLPVFEDDGREQLSLHQGFEDSNLLEYAAETPWPQISKETVILLNTTPVINPRELSDALKLNTEDEQVLRRVLTRMERALLAMNSEKVKGDVAPDAEMEEERSVRKL